jgi:PiT family inorganic phosphate transporter
MPECSLALLATVVVFALAFAFTNGLNDAANAIATAVGTRVLTPRAAVVMAGICNFAGTATGTAVARTIGKGILPSEDVTAWVLIAALAAVVVWGLFCTRVGLPISLSHGLVAGLVGAGAATVGWSAIQLDTLGKVVSAVAIAPAVGFAGGFAVMAMIMWLFRDSTPASIRSIFGNLQILSSAFMSYSHGKNDGQMAIGVITAALVARGWGDDLWDGIPWWVIGVSAATISLGIALGGWRVMRTLGARITTLRPVHGFAAQSSAAVVIEAASHLGIPVSTTHCISSSIMGVGATKRLSAVRWGIAGNMVAAWVITFPACGTLGYLLGWIFHATV